MVDDIHHAGKTYLFKYAYGIALFCLYFLFFFWREVWTLCCPIIWYVRLNICIYRFPLGFFYVIQREIIHENVMVYDIQRTDKAYLHK